MRLTDAPQQKKRATATFGSDIRLLAFGGSMVAGQYCTEGRLRPHSRPPPNASCAFPARLGKALASWCSVQPRLAHSNPLKVDVINLAHGGTTTVSMLPLLPAAVAPFAGDAEAGLPTLVLWDFSINVRARSGQLIPTVPDTC